MCLKIGSPLEYSSKLKELTAKFHDENIEFIENFIGDEEIRYYISRIRYLKKEAGLLELLALSSICKIKLCIHVEVI